MARSSAGRGDRRYTRAYGGVLARRGQAARTRTRTRCRSFRHRLRVASLEEARAEARQAADTGCRYQRQLLALVDTLIGSDPDEGITTDELMGVSGLSAEQVCAGAVRSGKTRHRQ